MTLDRQGAVAVCKVGCQQSFECFDNVRMCSGMGETLGDMHDFARNFGESELDGEARVGNGEAKDEILPLMLSTQDAIEDM